MRRVIPSLDIAKFICAFLVIAIHTFPLIDINPSANFVFVQIIARLAVPLFFVISGYLFFVKIDDRRNMNDYENKAKLKHTLFRLLKIYIIYSIVYLPFNYLLIKDGGISVSEIVAYVRNLLFTGSYYHLWFLPALMFAIIVIYYLKKYFKVNTILLISAILYLIGMLLNVYQNVLPSNILLDLYYKVFETSRNGLFFGCFFVSLGAFFAKRKGFIYSNTLLSLVGFVISFILLCIECFILRSLGIMHDLASMYLMLIPSVMFLFAFLLSIDIKEKAIYKCLRATSLMIYVIHLVFIIILNMLLPNLNSLITYILVCIASFIFAYLVYILSNKIKVLKHLY